MKNKAKRNFFVTLSLLLAFILWTIAIRSLDVQPIGPRGSSVGFAAFNGFLHERTGVHMLIYTITDWLGLVPVFIAFGFAMSGLIQLIKRRSLFKVDADILILGGFYIVVIATYVLFEVYVVNYRPVLINSYLEASYPSSTTLLVLCIMTTAIMQLNSRIENSRAIKLIDAVIILFTTFMVIGRLVSGVHWVTDIVGGILLSATLVMAYLSSTDLIKTR